MFFTYTGQDATSFDWDFGDGDFSTLEDPSHIYTEQGNYTVTLVATSPITCNVTDTFYLQINVLDNSSSLIDTAFCEGSGDVIYLDATTANATYSWQDGSSSATYSVGTPGTYWVDVFIDGCNRRDSFIVNSASNLDFDLGPDIAVCDQATYLLDGTTTGAIAYEWSNGSSNPSITVSNAGQYELSVTDNVGCIVSDEISISFGTTPTADIGPDMTLCAGVSITLNGTSSNNVSYSWQDGSTDPTFEVIAAGTYWVELDNNGCFDIDTVVIDYTPPPAVVYETNHISCYGECDGSILTTFTTSNTDYDFLWDTGNTDADLIDLCPGIYVLTLTDEFGCEFEEVFEIIEPDTLDFEINFQHVTCFGDADGSIEIMNVTGGVPAYSYSFNGGDFGSSPVLNNLSGGTFDLVMSDANGCTKEATIEIYEPPAVYIFAGDDRTIELGDTAHINGYVFPIQNQIISWSPPDSLWCLDCPDPIAMPTATTLYTMTVVDSITGCTQLDEVLLRVDKQRNIYIPNAFSPNADGINDFFMIYSGQGVRQILNFKIFDRWGELIYEVTNFQANDYRKGWNGSFKGKPMNPGVFVYVAEVEFIDDVRLIYSGDVSLLK